MPGAEIGRYAYEKHAGDDDFVQPRTLINDVMSETDREHRQACSQAVDATHAPS